MEELSELVKKREGFQDELQRLMHKTWMLPGETVPMNKQQLETRKYSFQKELFDLGSIKGLVSNAVPQLVRGVV